MRRTVDPVSYETVDSRRLARRWLGVAIGSLLLAGLLSFALVVGRLPGLHEMFTDPDFFRRALVVHVVLALVVWFLAFVTALFFTIGSREKPGLHTTAGSGIAAVGVATLLASAGVAGSAPILSNYVPVIDNDVFVAGLSLFGLGVVLALLDPRLLPRPDEPMGFLRVPAAAVVGIRAAAILLLLAGVTFAASIVSVPFGLPAETTWEMRMWGGGHVLQVASTAGMLACWIILLERALGESPISRRVASVLFGVLVIPQLASPLIALVGTGDARYDAVFTFMMRWAIWPVVSVVLALSLRALWRAKREGMIARWWREPQIVVFATSALMTVAGFVLGAMIRGPNTMIPAHYHASIGAVTTVYMGVTWLMLAPLAMGLREGWLRRVAPFQPSIFGAGQLIFAIGFGMAGAHGMARKAYGTDQEIRTALEWVGLSVMGIGGLIAVTGGMLFLLVVIRAWRGRPGEPATKGKVRWTKTRSIRSSG